MSHSLVIGRFQTPRAGRFEDEKYGLETVFLDGELVNFQTFLEVKDLADRGLL